MGHIKNILRQWTPPAVWNLARRGAERLLHRRDFLDGGEKGKDWYDAVYASRPVYAVHYTASRYHFLWCVVVDRMVRRGVSSILDIGCGPGQFAACLRDRGFARYLGIDLSDTAVAMARKACPEFSFVAADVFESDLIETAEYDAVTSMEFLEHVERDLEVLKRIPPGTRVFATVPNFPDAAHVRHFRGAEEVLQRYKPLFADFRVDAFPADEKGTTYFMLEGVRE